MLQRQIVKFLGKQIEYPVGAKDVITSIHSLTWILISVIVTIYRTEIQQLLCIVTTQLRSRICIMTIIESLGPAAATLGGGFFVGVLIGYVLKKVIKIAAVIVGLFLSALAYLQHQQIANINWNKFHQISEHTITALSNAIMQIPTVGHTSDQVAASLTMTSFGIPLTGSISAGFTIGFMKG